MRVDASGVGIEVEESGDPAGPVLLLMHGLSWCSAYWRWLGPEIVAGRRVLAMDLRGHGHSDRTPGGYHIQRYADDAIAVLEAADVTADRPALLVGHSLGASTAWTVTQRRPDLVAGAVLEDPPVYAGEAAEYPGSAAQVAFPIMRARIVEWQAAGLDHDAWVARAATLPSGARSDWTISEEITEDAVDARATALSLVDPDTVLAATTIETLEGTDTVTPLGSPTLLLRADATMGPAMAPRNADRFAADHPEVEVLEIAGAGHYISISRAAQDRFATILADFLARHAPLR